jgi:F-type H+-transporting ATPase subunit delta
LKIEPLSVTYARALVELAREAGRLDTVLEDVRFLRELLSTNHEFRIFLESPSIGSRAKQESLDRAFRGKLDDLTLNFLDLVVKKKRHFLLPEIFAECELLYDQAVGRVQLEAVTAVPLSKPRQEELAAAVKGKLLRKVVLVNTVRPEILGGLIIRQGDFVADGSIRTALSRVAEKLKSRKLGSELVHEN